MAFLTIPIDDAEELGNFIFSVDLDGEDFQLDFAYNERDDSWYFSVLDMDGNPLRSGIRVVSNFPLLLRWKEANRPAGELWSMDTRGEGIEDDPGLADLGVNSIFSYDEEDE